nr:cyclodeaminase/cyclohydrolase family protein [Caldilineaceae bacterium]
MSFGSMSTREFLDVLAAGEPTPGGGGAAALTGSAAAALISMVINFTVGRKKYAAVEEEMRGYLAESEALRQELLGLADADAAAFEGVAATYKL